jgi:CheY-like chemotaxis protein
MTMQLPTSAAATEWAQPKRLGPSQAPDRRTVLIIDDCSFNIEMMRAALESRGYKVVATQDSRAAPKLARESDPDLVLCDLRMPGPDGFTVLSILHADAKLCSRPFIFISATILSDDERRLGRALGATRFLSYPIHPSHLLDEVDGLLRRYS